MTQNELNRFQAILMTRVGELEGFLRQRDGITIERSADELEEIQQASERALAICNLDRESNQLQNVRAALRRIKEGCFGTCQECDEEISLKRLAAIPWAPFCIVCQEAFDRNPEELAAPTGNFLARAA